MSNAVVILPVRATIASRWQIPVFVVGITTFGLGLQDIVSGYRLRTFAEDVADIGLLRSRGEQTRACAFIADLLENEERPAEERAELHRLMAAAIHDAESMVTVHEPRNVESILSNFQSAARLGLMPGWMDWVIASNAYDWAGRPDESVDALRQALRLNPSRPDNIRRQMVERMYASGERENSEAAGLLDQIMDDASASAANYLWALDQRVVQLLAQGELATASGLVEQARDRLAGTPEALALDYSKALCLHKAGRLEEAELTLRALRNAWQIPDTLWAKTGWLLGRIQEEEDRPQTGLSFLDEVLAVYQSGDIHDACQFWRGQCLASLDRHEKALEAFELLKEELLRSKRFRQYDLNRDVLRNTLSVWGETLMQRAGAEGGEVDAADRMTGVRYLRMALSLADPDAERLREGYLRRIAGGLGAIAGAIEVAGGKDAAEKARHYHDEAAQAYLDLAGVSEMDENAAADALWLATDHLDQAGRQDRTIELLAQFVDKYPNNDRRLAALHRLGQAYQAASRFTEAADAYRQAVDGYLPALDAQRSLVPLAQCLIRIGGVNAEQGVRLLLNLVEDKLPSTLLEPAAIEYREALFQLGEYYAHADESVAPQHLERAIEWLEQAASFYPDDPRIPKMKFLLADSYRKSARALQREEAALVSAEAKASSAAEARQRLGRALVYFTDVVATLASQDDAALSPLERTQLRAGYLYRADCLFDLARYDEAIAAYQEAAWRYEGEPAAVIATLQVIHCHQRLGQREEALAALGRARWLIRTIPETAFERQAGMPARSYWEEQVDRLTRMLSGES